MEACTASIERPCGGRLAISERDHSSTLARYSGRNAPAWWNVAGQKRRFDRHNRHEPCGPNFPLLGHVRMPFRGLFRTKKQICGRPSIGSAAFGGGTNLVFVREAGMARHGPLGSLAGSDGCLRLATKQVHGLRNRTEELPVQAQSCPAARHTPLPEATASGTGIPKPTGSALD